MAARRMFSRKIVSSARFLRLPAICQALYYQLGVNADDDGVVEAYMTVRAVGASEDDLRTLEDQGFIRILNEDLVTYITDWVENNRIRPDRKTDSIYKELLDMEGVETIEKRPRSKAKQEPEAVEKEPSADTCPDNGPDMARTSPDNGGTLPRIGLGLGSGLGKDINNNTLTVTGERVPSKAAIDAEFDKLWRIYPKKRGKTEALKAYRKARKEGITEQEISDGLAAFCASVKGSDPQFIPYGSTWFYQRRWIDDYRERAPDISTHGWDYAELERKAQDAIYHAV